MSKPNEVELANSLSGFVTSRFPNLKVVFPKSGSFSLAGASYPATDMVVINPATNHAIGIELTAVDGTLPLGLYPTWKSMHEGFKMNSGEFFAVTTGSLPQSFVSNAVASGIHVVANAKPEAPNWLSAIEPSLSQLSRVG